MKIEISKTFKADIAHIVETQYLTENLLPKCRHIHGHTIKIQPIIKGYIDNKTKMVLDYTYLQPFKKFIDIFLDHSFILPRNTKFPYKEIEKIFTTFYNQLYKDECNSNVNENKLWKKKFEYNNKLIACRYTTITLLDTPSTTAEYMTIYLTKVLAILLTKHTNIDITSTQIKVRFFETENSYAENEFNTIEEVLKTV